MRVRRRKSSSGANAEHAERFASDKLSKSNALPFVLTAAAVRAGAIPPLGDPGMAPTLAASVPAEFRYWQAVDVETAKSVRDALVEAEIFDDDSIALVDGSPYRIVSKRFLAVVDDVEAEPVRKADDAILAASLFVGEVEVVDLRADASTRSTTDRWVALVRDDADGALLAKELGGVSFRVTTRPGTLFVSKSTPRATRLVEFVESRVDALAKSAPARARFVKADDAIEERYVLGIVLEPETVDAQADIYSADEVRSAAHKFLENYGQIGLQHAEIVTGKIKILESYLAPADFAVGAQTVKRGTWLLGVRVVDDALWQSVKDGSYTGFSIGGSAVRAPDGAALA
jgi:hypothetical protein